MVLASAGKYDVSRQLAGPTVIAPPPALAPAVVGMKQLSDAA